MGRLIKASSKTQKASRRKANEKARQYQSQKNAIDKIRNLIRITFLRNILRRKLINMRDAKFHANVKITTSIKQVDKKQDFVSSGTDPNGDFKFIVVADGHGGNKTIDKFRSSDWTKVLSFENFIDIIYEEIKALGNTNDDGATLTIVKIFRTHIYVYWIGDSSARVYKNGAEIFRTKEHDMYNEDEMKRIIHVRQRETVRLCAQTSEIVTQIPARYFEFNRFMNHLNMSHSLGHNGVTGKFMSHERIPITDGDTYNVIVGSDGFWDMMCDEDNLLLSSNSVNSVMLLKLALTRWNKTDWKFERQYISPKFPAFTKEKTSIGLGDDVCVAVATF